MTRAGGLFFIFYIWTALGLANAEPVFPVVQQVRAIIEAPAETLDYASAKIMIDQLVDPSVDAAATLAEIDHMAGAVKEMIATIPASEQAKSIERLRALKAFIYRPGDWNDHRPFQYDLDDPYGDVFETRLLSGYLKSRKGNCISMPILFLALGERLDLDLSLSTAPLHLLVKYTDEQTGKTYNLEPTSGAGFTRDEHYIDQMPITAQAIDNGVFLKHLSRKESLAVMAGIVVEWLIDKKRYDEAIAVADVLIEAYPANGYMMAKKGTAYFHLLHDEFISRYETEGDIPADELVRAKHLSEQNNRAFSEAEALGWRQSSLR